MRMDIDRAVLTIMRHAGSWVVEQDGEHFGRTDNREAAMAFANRRAREIQDAGRACQVRVSGEQGFYPAR